MPIPAVTTDIHGITDKDVAGAPLIADVIMDFYKFAQNSVLVGHNIAFDMGMIARAGENLGCVFDNERLDTIKLAQEHIRGLSRFNLAIVCKTLGIENLRAHRAASDTLATAEVLLKLAPKIAV
jgi:DNA polymerase III epsilon subunit-like protein